MDVESLLLAPRVTVMVWTLYCTDMRMWGVENYAPLPNRKTFFSWGDFSDTTFASV